MKHIYIVSTEQGHNDSLKLKYLDNMYMVVIEKYLLLNKELWNDINRWKQANKESINRYISNESILQYRKINDSGRSVDDQNFFLLLTLLHTFGGFRLHQ